MSMAVPIVVVAVLVLGVIKRVNVFSSFTNGAKQAIPLMINLFPFLFAILLALKLCTAVGLIDVLQQALAPLLKLLGIPEELTGLILLRPFSGSGSLALVSDIYTKYGVDSFVARCASVIMGSTETVFYLSAVYFSKTDIKKLGWAMPIALFCSFLSGVISCIACKIFV